MKVFLIIFLQTILLAVSTTKSTSDNAKPFIFRAHCDLSRPQISYFFRHWKPLANSE